jgi:hypothetical protein
MFFPMGGWVSGLVLTIAGAGLLWVSAAQFSVVFDYEQAAASGRVARVYDDGQRYAIDLAGRPERFVLPSAMLAHPSPAAIENTDVSLMYDARADGRTFVISGLTANGRTYFSSADYQMLGLLGALVVFLPAAILLGFGFNALNGAMRVADEDDESYRKTVGLPLREAVVIQFPTGRIRSSEPPLFD